MADLLSTAAAHSVVCVGPRAMTPAIDISRPETSFEDAQLPGCGRCCARAQAHSTPVRNTPIRTRRCGAQPQPNSQPRQRQVYEILKTRKTVHLLLRNTNEPQDIGRFAVPLHKGVTIRTADEQSAMWLVHVQKSPTVGPGAVRDLEAKTLQDSEKKHTRRKGLGAA